MGNNINFNLGNCYLNWFRKSHLLRHPNHLHLISCFRNIIRRVLPELKEQNLFHLNLKSFSTPIQIMDAFGFFLQFVRSWFGNDPFCSLFFNRSKTNLFRQVRFLRFFFTYFVNFFTERSFSKIVRSIKKGRFFKCSQEKSFVQ